MPSSADDLPPGDELTTVEKKEYLADFLGLYDPHTPEIVMDGFRPQNTHERWFRGDPLAIEDVSDETITCRNINEPATPKEISIDRVYEIYRNNRDCWRADIGTHCPDEQRDFAVFLEFPQEDDHQHYVDTVTIDMTGRDWETVEALAVVDALENNHIDPDEYADAQIYVLDFAGDTPQPVGDILE